MISKLDVAYGEVVCSFVCYQKLNRRWGGRNKEKGENREKKERKRKEEKITRIYNDKKKTVGSLTNTLNGHDTL